MQICARHCSLVSGDHSITIVGRDPGIDRLSGYLNLSFEKPAIGSFVLQKVGRISADLLVVRSAVFTLVIADTVMPVLPPPAKLAALATAALAAVSFAGATVDIGFQISELIGAAADPTQLGSKDKLEIADRLDKMIDPIGAVVDHVLNAMKKMGFEGTELAALLKESKALGDAQEKARNASTLDNKIVYGLAVLETFRKFIEKVPPEIRKKIEESGKKDPVEKDNFKDPKNRTYPNGVDGKNPPGQNVPGVGDDQGTAVA